MAHTLAAYYTDELSTWSKHIAMYNEEMDFFEQKLIEIIQRNSIPHIADKVEQQQDKLNDVSEKFYRLQLLIDHQDELLRTDDKLVEDKSISNETDRLQNELRNHMQETEKEYIDIKYACQQFILDILKR